MSWFCKKGVSIDLKHAFYRAEQCLSIGTGEYCLHLYINLYHPHHVPRIHLIKKALVHQNIDYPQFGSREFEVEFGNRIGRCPRGTVNSLSFS